MKATRPAGAATAIAPDPLEVVAGAPVPVAEPVVGAEGLALPVDDGLAAVEEAPVAEAEPEPEAATEPAPTASVAAALSVAARKVPVAASPPPVAVRVGAVYSAVPVGA